MHGYNVQYVPPMTNIEMYTQHISDFKIPSRHIHHIFQRVSSSYQVPNTSRSVHHTQKNLTNTYSSTMTRIRNHKQPGPRPRFVQFPRRLRRTNDIISSLDYTPFPSSAFVPARKVYLLHTRNTPNPLHILFLQDVPLLQPRPISLIMRFQRRMRHHPILIHQFVVRRGGMRQRANC
jgi:hypothetical protein